MKEREGYREEAKERNHEEMEKIVGDRRKYLMLLKEEAANWVTKDNLEEKIRAAIDNPVEYKSHLSAVMAMEEALAIRLKEMQLSEPILHWDTEINPINLY